MAIDYRLLHGTHGNASSVRRDGVMLTFTPSWQDLLLDIKAHLINHRALPSDNEPSVKTSYPKDFFAELLWNRKRLRAKSFDTF
jgi:hypothetical protein